MSAWTLTVNSLRAAMGEVVRSFLPRHYEPGYHYPLIVYLHDNDRSDDDLGEWFPAISDQNFVSIAVSAPFPNPLGLPGRFRWKPGRPDSSLGAIREVIELAECEFSIHPSRIYLFGEGVGAIVALQAMLLQQSGYCDEFPRLAGVITRQMPPFWARCLPPIMTVPNSRLLMLDDDHSAIADAALESFRDAGIDVSIQNSLEFTPADKINRWMMENIPTAIS